MEVFILGRDDGAMGDRPIPDGIILRISQPDIPYSGRVMSAFRQPRTQGGRQIGINEKFHAAVVNTGWSIWEAAYMSDARMSSASRSG